MINRKPQPQIPKRIILAQPVSGGYLFLLRILEISVLADPALIFILGYLTVCKVDKLSNWVYVIYIKQNKEKYRINLGCDQI